MSRTDIHMRRTWRLILVTGFLSLLAIGFVQVSLNRVAQAQESKPSAAPAGQPRLEGEIEDDPTVAPDSAESADNNISFPIDI